MLVRKVTEAQLEASAKRVGLRLYDLRPVGRGFRFRLHTTGGVKVNGRVPRYGRVSAHMVNKNGKPRRIPGAVCWHGHRDFLAVLFYAAPQAKVVTAFVTYNGRDDFFQKYPQTEYRNIGSQFRPVAYSECCECGPEVSELPHKYPTP